MKTVLLSKGKPAQTLLEFALVLPVLLMVAFFILDFGRAVYYYSALYNGSREGARYGITLLYLTDNMDLTKEAQISVIAKQHLYGIPADQVTVTAIIAPPPPATRRWLSVTTIYTYTPVTPFLSLLLPTGITLQNTSKMRLEPRLNMQLIPDFSFD